MIIKPYIDDGSTVRSLFIWSLLMADFKIEIVFNKQFANSRQRTVTRSIFFAAHFLNRQKKKKKKNSRRRSPSSLFKTRSGLLSRRLELSSHWNSYCHINVIVDHPDDNSPNPIKRVSATKDFFIFLFFIKK
jgi:hypothetical protein